MNFFFLSFEVLFLKMLGNVYGFHSSYLFSIPLSIEEEQQGQRKAEADLSRLPSYPFLYEYFSLQE